MPEQCKQSVRHAQPNAKINFILKCLKFVFCEQWIASCRIVNRNTAPVTKESLDFHTDARWQIVDVDQSQPAFSQAQDKRHRVQCAARRLANAFRASFGNYCRRSGGSFIRVPNGRSGRTIVLREQALRHRIDCILPSNGWEFNVTPVGTRHFSNIFPFYE